MLLESQIKYIQANKDLLSQKEEMEKMADYCNLSLRSFKRQIRKDYQLLEYAGFQQTKHPIGYLAARIRTRVKRANTKSKSTRYGSIEQVIKAKDLIVLWEGQEGKCAITGVKMILPGSSTAGFLRRSPFNVSVDRKDSRLSYTLDNVQLVALGTNTGKNRLTLEQYNEFLQDVASMLK